MSERRGASSIAAEWLHRAESVVLVLIGIVLIVIAVLLLGNSVTSLVTLVNPSGTASSVRDLTIEILDSVLLVMMTMEIVYTVAISLESHQLVAEPFLITGAIAAIRRMLVITAEGTKVGEDLEHLPPGPYWSWLCSRSSSWRWQAPYMSFGGVSIIWPRRTWERNQKADSRGQCTMAAHQHARCAG